ncbi:uncharacterized protein TNCV_1737961 [Trichonephila clavipes]|nr:uncharacterized protein TNCV_1737961 [Trichonephila clavipes]
MPQGSVLSPTLFSLYLSGIESVIKRKCKVGAFADDIVLWKSDFDLTKLERDINLVLEDIRNFTLDYKLTFNHTKSVRLRYKSSETRKGQAQRCSDHHWPKKYLSQRYSTFRGGPTTPLSLRRRACLTKYYNKLRSLDSRNLTSVSKIGVITRDSGETVPSAEWSLLTLPLVLWNLITCHNVLTQRKTLTGSSSIHTKLPVHVNKQADLPAYLKQLALERIGDIPIDALQVYTDGSRDDYYQSSSGIYSKSQDHILRIQRRNLDGCSGFRNLERNEIADTLVKAGACEGTSPVRTPHLFEINSRTKHQNKAAPEHHWYQCSRPGGSLAHGLSRQDQTLLARFRSGHIKSMKFSEGRKSFEMCTNVLLSWPRLLTSSSA